MYSLAEIDHYKRQAKRWQEAADALPPGEARRTWLGLAEGYRKLVDLIEKLGASEAPCDSRR